MAPTGLAPWPPSWLVLWRASPSCVAASRDVAQSVAASRARRILRFRIFIHFLNHLSHNRSFFNSLNYSAIWGLVVRSPQRMLVPKSKLSPRSSTVALSGPLTDMTRPAPSLSARSRVRSYSR